MATRQGDLAFSPHHLATQFQCVWRLLMATNEVATTLASQQTGIKQKVQVKKRSSEKEFQVRSPRSSPEGGDQLSREDHCLVEGKARSPRRSPPTSEVSASDHRRKRRRSAVATMFAAH
ncbi:hypothetical protein LWI29_027003 [Acer saccharum]|uniref:Uncharacterized protein n=1 Tax=Acer saccharum TaxID=4024 RepID=A0AA39SNA3_ACESA|nr:hypothetical protein LWI29_027003 [Acer saccharum]